MQELKIGVLCRFDLMLSKGPSWKKGYSNVVKVMSIREIQDKLLDGYVPPFRLLC